MKQKPLIVLIFLLIFQNAFSQDLEGYFEKYYEEGNFVRLQEAVDLGLDPNTTRIKNLSMANYVFSNSTNEAKIINVMDILIKAGLKLNEPNLFQKIVQRRSRKTIDYLQSQKVNIASITANNQNGFSTNYLEYLKEKGFKIDESIIPRRKFEIKKARFISNLKEGKIDSVRVGLNTFMSNKEMGPVELYYALKTKDTIFVDEILAKSPKDIVAKRYTSVWNKLVYGEKPQNLSKSDYPLKWAMGTNNLNVVKYLLNKGAEPLENGNSNSLPSIQNYVNSEYKLRWHKRFNSEYEANRVNYEKQANFSSYKVLQNSLLKEIINKKFVKKVKRSFGLFSSYNKDFFIELKFLMNGKQIDDISVVTNSTNDTKSLKEFLIKPENKRFFQKLFERLKYKEINYRFAYPEKIE